MGETHSPSVAHMGYDISPLSRVKFKILLSSVEKYRNPRATEGEYIYHFYFRRFILREKCQREKKIHDKNYMSCC
jgi:hypothetical protein